MADNLNGYFVEKIVKTKRQLGPPTQDPLLKVKSAMGRWQGCGSIKSFDFKPIDVKVVKNNEEAQKEQC